MSYFRNLTELTETHELRRMGISSDTIRTLYSRTGLLLGGGRVSGDAGMPGESIEVKVEAEANLQWAEVKATARWIAGFKTFLNAPEIDYSDGKGGFRARRFPRS